MDPRNTVVRLCTEGIAAEAAGRGEAAHALFRRAWDAASDDYEACVAAHYLARHQPTPEDTLRWNRTCLELADRVGDERVRPFYPSLHGALGRALLERGERGEARAHFEAGAARLADLPPGPYADWLRLRVADGLRATDPRPAAAPDPLRPLLDRLCARADLASLALLLPPYLANLHGPEDEERLTTALCMLHAERRLPEPDLTALADVIASRRPSATAARGPKGRPT
ncbi:hypothetical protein [Streptomyces sp. Isolate_45]|uniref:hypothetical protein n=1 Tax=Streptomyces sp. Isolate_45 TaxID=2950111 RepID=UPI0024819BA8|nr:hypothetical protein [Streptomyces sp. Isolate_45]MDA5280802.1 hypothetical protein [Streptomyces sp. Isolate_45]